MALDTVTLHGQILAPVTNAPASGTVTFKILQELRDNADNVIYSPQTFTATLDINGEFSIVLPVTDDPTVTPVDWTYWVYVNTDVWVSGVFYIPLPSALGPVVEFADLLPLSSTGSCAPSGVACAPIGSVAALQAEIDALEVVVDGVIADLDVVEVTVGALVGQVNVISPIVFQNQADIAQLQIDVAQIAADLGVAEGQIVIINGQIVVIQGQITTIQGQILTLQTDLDAAELDIDNLQAAQTATQAELDALEANVMYEDPPLVAGIYQSNAMIFPPIGATNPTGEPHTTGVAPYSPADTNPDFWVLYARNVTNNLVKVLWINGNMELRCSPSQSNRVGFRAFESAQVEGFSTGIYASFSSNPTITANREPYFALYGSVAAGRIGWAEATRVLSGLMGVSIGGTTNAALAPYNSLTALVFRGFQTTPGSPAAGTWLVRDVVMDSVGTLYRCTVAGTPGTWVGVNAPGAYVNMTPGTNMSLDANYPAASRLDRGADNVRLAGTLTAGAIIASGAVIATITAAHRPTSALRPKTFIVRTTSGGARGRVTNLGELTLNAGLAAADNVWLDSITFDQL